VFASKNKINNAKDAKDAKERNFTQKFFCAQKLLREKDIFNRPLASFSVFCVFSVFSVYLPVFSNGQIRAFMNNFITFMQHYLIKHLLSNVLKPTMGISHFPFPGIEAGIQGRGPGCSFNRFNGVAV